MAIKKVDRKGKAKDAEIESKDQRWHCRNRITLVFGSNDVEELDTYVYTPKGIEFKTVNFHQAKSKAIEEVLDNCIDEFYRGHVTEIHTWLSKDHKRVIVEDNGIGFPTTKVKQVYQEFRTGSKFRDEETDKKGYLNRTLGQNGLGAAATCLTSDEFIARIRHYNTKKEQTTTFIDGALKVKQTKAKTFKGHSGVRVELSLSKEVYKNNTIDEELLRKRIIDLAYNNPGLVFYYNDEKYIFKKGLYELAQRVGGDNAQSFGDLTYTYETKGLKSGKKLKGKIDISLDLAVDMESDDREKFISFANSTPTYDGGFHHDRVKRLFVNTIKDKVERVVKKEKISIVDNDILTGITFILGITMPNPRFESQTKRKLVRDINLEKAIESLMSKHMDKWIKKNRDYLELILERARSRHKFQALKDASKAGRKHSKRRIEKLLDANERRDRTKCTLFICEGDSAIGGLRSARNKLYQGGIALKGKPMNVSQASIQEILDNQEFSDIMASVGLTIGQTPDFPKLRYSKIVFLADSDVDGGHINTLLTNFFYTFWPELFKERAIQIAKAPLFEVITDQGREYVESPDQLETLKNKKGSKIKEIQRNKGLGEMSPEAFNFVMKRENYTVLEVNDAHEAKKTLDMCFGKDTGPRKELLLDGESANTASVQRAIKKARLKTRALSSSKLKKKTASKKKAASKKKTAFKKKTSKKKATTLKTLKKKTAKKKVAKKSKKKSSKRKK